MSEEQITPDELQNMSAQELSKYQAGWRPQTENYILCEKEWQRRFMIAQHDLDKRLIYKQIKWVQISIAVSFIGVLIASFATIYNSTLQEDTLQQILQEHPSIDKQLSESQKKQTH